MKYLPDRRWGLNVAWRTEPHTGTRRDGFRPSPITNSLCDLELVLSLPWNLDFMSEKPSLSHHIPENKVPGAVPEAPSQRKGPHIGIKLMVLTGCRVTSAESGFGDEVQGTLLGKWSEQ